MKIQDLVAPALSGLIFSIGLALGGMTDPAKVLGFLDFAGSWDPSLAFVMAGAMGGHGERVETRAQLAAALDQAVARRGMFSLIEVMLPRGATSDTLARFVAGFKAAREAQQKS